MTLNEWLFVLTSCGWFMDAVFLFKFYLISSKMLMLCRAEVPHPGLEVGVLFLDRAVRQRMIEDPEFAGITDDWEMQLASAVLPVPVRETSQRRGFFKLDSRRFSYLKPHFFTEFFVLS